MPNSQIKCYRAEFKLVIFKSFFFLKWLRIKEMQRTDEGTVVTMVTVGKSQRGRRLHSHPSLSLLA